MQTEVSIVVRISEDDVYEYRRTLFLAVVCRRTVWKRGNMQWLKWVKGVKDLVNGSESIFFFLSAAVNQFSL